MMCYTIWYDGGMTSLQERLRIATAFINRQMDKFEGSVSRDSARMREPDEYPCPSATMTCPPEETVQLTAMCVSPRPAQNPADTIPTEVWVRAELVERLREALVPAGSQQIVRVERVVPAARALVDAVERSAAGEGEATQPTCTHGNDLRYRCEDCEGWTDMGDPAHAPVPVSDEAGAATFGRDRW